MIRTVVLSGEMLKPVIAQDSSVRGLTQWRIERSSPIQKWRSRLVDFVRRFGLAVRR